MDKLSFDKKSKLKKEVKTLQETVLTQNFQIKSLKIESKIEKSYIQFANQFLQIPSDRKDQFLNIDFSSMETICSACFFYIFYKLNLGVDVLTLCLYQNRNYPKFQFLLLLLHFHFLSLLHHHHWI